jgi:peptidyl-prolyl cis-trans isomerase B (cyclophilin B)
MSNRIAKLDTNKGVIRFELYEDLAPITTQNFIELTDTGFYNGLKFHRYEPGFVIQGGDPKGDGTGGSGRTIPLEVTPKLKHDSAGVVAMARSQNPNSASCQFYITLAPASFLDQNYAVFGRVTEGLDNVLALRKGDVISKVIIEPEVG